MRPFVPIILNQSATVLLGLLSVRLVTHYVPVDVNGVYTIFLTLTQVGMLITHSGLVNHASRYWQREHERTGPYARFLAGASIRILIFLAPILFLITCGMGWMEGKSTWLFAFPFLLVGSFSLALNLVATQALNAERSFWKVFCVTAIANGARAVLPVAIALFTSMSLHSLSVGFAVHGFVIFACLTIVFRKTAQAPPVAEDIRLNWTSELKTYGRPFVLLGIGAWLFQFADRWVTASFFGSSEAGLLGIAANLTAMVPAIAIQGMMQWIFPRIFLMSDKAKTRDDWRHIALRCDQATGVFLVLTILGIVALKLIAPFLVGWLIGEDYVPAFEMLIPVGFAMVAAQVNQFYYLLLQGQHNSAGMVKVMLTVSGVKTGGSIIAASISWAAFEWWMIASLFISGILGRMMIRAIALGESDRTLP